MAFLSDLLALVTTPSGGLAYHLATLFAVQFILGVAFEHWARHRRNPDAIQLLVTGIGLLLARVLLIVAALLGRLGVVSFSVVAPPLERFLELSTLVLIAGSLLPILERHSRLRVPLLLFLLLMATAVYVGFAALWPTAEAQGIAYNDYWQAGVWECVTVGLLVLVTLAGLVWRRGDWGLMTSMFILWLFGHGLQCLLPSADSHVAGWVQLSNLAALPLLAALVYRYAMRSSWPSAGETADVQSWLRRGMSAARAGDHTLARRCFQTVRETDPDNVTALLWLAWLALTRLESLALLSRVLELDPENEHAHAGIRWARRPMPIQRNQVVIGTARRPQVEPLSGQLDRRTGMLADAMGVLLRFSWRVATALALLVALVFFVALAIDLQEAGGLQHLPSSIPSALGFTVEYLAGLAHGDMGTVARSAASLSAASVVSKLARALPRSLGLLAVSLTLAVLVGLPLGIGAGLRRKTHFSGLLVFLSVLGISTPSYLAAMLLVWGNVWLYRTTGADFLPVHGFGWDAHVILPALVLAARPAANVMRLGHNALVDVLDADFVRTAHAKGLGPWLVLMRHVLRAAGVPLVTTVAVSLRFSLAVLPIVEYIFSWSGVGEELLAAIQMQDTTTAIGMVLPLALLLVIVNLLLEILCPILDPRLRVKEVGAV
jgi:peptide/nickel transport system permease protein